MLGPEHVGRRVAVRLALAEPGPGRRYRDVTGELVEAGARWRVRTASGELVEIDPAQVAAAKPIPPKPTPFSEVLELERLLAATWPAVEAEELGGWLLRYASGFSRRANSALALTAPPGGTGAAVAAVEAWYAARGARPLIALAGPLTRRLDGELDERSWAAEGETAVMVRPVGSVGYSGPAVVRDAPSPEFLDQTARGLPEAAARVFGSGPGRGFAEVRIGGALVALGRGALAGDVVAITNIGTVPAFRRRGLGTEVLRALETWGAAAGATRAALQVEADNGPALAMYGRLGYAERYRYRYRGPAV